MYEMSDGKDNFMGERATKTISGRKNGAWCFWDFKECVMAGGSGCSLFSGRDESKGNRGLVMGKTLISKSRSLDLIMKTLGTL